MVKTISKPLGYEALKTRKASGAHYTPIDLADFVARHICSKLEKKTSNIILDPAVGDGELLASLAKIVTGKAKFYGYDVDQAAIDEATLRLQSLSPAIDLQLEKKDFLNDVDSDAQASLFEASRQPVKADVVIANPPYIRTQVLGATQSKALATKYGLSGRVDIYHAFIAKIAEILKPGGIAGIIVSNRFMYTQGGKSIRELILREFDIQHIWDFGDTKLFEAAVLPAVLILKKKTSKVEQASTRFTSIYTNSSVEYSTKTSGSIFDALEGNGVVEVRGSQYIVNTGILHIDDGQPWRISEQNRDDWLGKVKLKTHCHFEDIAKVKVGVKTTADKVFIRDDWTDEGDLELLLPLVTHHVAHRFKASLPKRKILYPYNLEIDSKKPVDLNDYKKTKKYLEKHKEQLAGRSYVIEAGRQWYEIWVPHNPPQWKHPKVVFRDISEKPTFWADFEGSIVNGDCYWMSLPEDHQEYIWLILAVANSSFIEKYYDYMFNNKLYSGRRRFISQYVNKFPLPDPNTPLACQAVDIAKSIYNDSAGKNREAQEYQLDALIWELFEVN